MDNYELIYWQDINKDGMYTMLAQYKWRNPYDVVSGYKQARLFEYTEENGSIINSDKTFEITIATVATKLSTQYRNYMVDVLMSSAEANEMGMLEFKMQADGENAQEWYLQCRCIGVTDIQYDRNGVAKFKAKFYAPRNVWYKREDVVTITKSGSTIRYASQNYGTTSNTYDFSDTSESARYALGFAISGLTGTVSFRAYDRWLDPSLATTWKYYYTFTLPTGASGSLVTSDYPNKTVKQGDYNAFHYVPTGIDIFAEMPFAQYRLSSENFDATSVIMTVYKLRGMPPWL